MIEVLLYSCLFFNIHLRDEHDFGDFPDYLGYAEAKWNCDGKWIGSHTRNSSLNESAGKNGILRPQRHMILKIKIMRRHKNECLLFLILRLNESILIKGIKQVI